ncbi:MFS transporter [Actinophytocola sp.]|uniref:MFS transporter n=1 Tax=Actinophytocola sp. TaxID=1872138 RepID=UPI002D8072EE|nr:MFS transporter [Actinophytocola sp.]HET9142402.1 MFS transporter [Actinophytocola sp.]
MGVLVYVLAMFHRTSLGVAGLEAIDRFHVGPAALGMFTVLQVGLYALMQVPTGLLVDHFGPRRVLTAAALLMGTGQLMFAMAATYPLGLAARAVLGIGDAMTFVSVLRLVAAHFPPRRYAALVAVTGTLGALGNLAATVPLTLLLGHAGWTTTFAVAGAVTVAYAAVAALRLRDVPAGTVLTEARPAVSLRKVHADVTRSWNVPGTRLGFWVHFSTMFGPAVLGLLWGFPYLVEAQGLTPGVAGSVLSVLVLGVLVGGPLVGTVTGRHPRWRMPFVIGYLVSALATWTVLLGWPGGHVPLAVLVLAFGWLSIGGPASGIGFALARDYNPMRRMSTASGVVNVGGFVATTVSALAIGLLLDLTGSFRIALLSVAALLVLGCWRTMVWWRRARAAVFAAQERGEEVPVPLPRRRRWDVEAALAA